MRNPDLDKTLPEDSKIGDLQKDDDGREFKMINGEKIYQIGNDDDMDLIINRVRASGVSPWVYLKGGM